MDDLYANWARIYDYFYPDRSREVALWDRLARSHGRRVLDLMCGTAEVSLGMAQRGYRVLGVDLSPAMLSVGAERLAAAAEFPARNLWLAQGDARAIAAPNAALDFAIVGGNGSFNHLDDSEARASLAELRRVLRPGGGLGLELVNPFLLEQIEPERTFGPLRPTPPGVWVERASTNHYDREAGQFHIQQTTRYEIGSERGEFEEAFILHIWAPDVVQAMLEGAGFEPVRVYGDYSLEPFDRWSPDLLVVAEVPK